MTDKSDTEIKAIRESLPGVDNLICFFHLKQAWERYLKAAKNGVRNGINTIRNNQKSTKHDKSEEIT